MPNKIGNSHINPDFGMRPPEGDHLKRSRKPIRRHNKKVDRIFGLPGVKDVNALIKPDNIKAAKVKVGGGDKDKKVQNVAKASKKETAQIDDLVSGMTNLRMSTENVDQEKPALILSSDNPQIMDVRDDPSTPLSHEQISIQPMDISEDLNSLASDLMDLEEDKVPKSRQIQRMIDDLAGFDPTKLPEKDVIMTESADDQTPMDWKSTWKGFAPISDILTQMESKIQFVEIPDYEMTDPDIDMVPADEIVPDQEMSQADEEMIPASQAPPNVMGPMPAPSGVPQPTIHSPPNFVLDLGPINPSAVASPPHPDRSSHLNFAPVGVARRQPIAGQRSAPAAIPQVGFSREHGVQQAKQLMQANRFDAAIVLLSKIYSGSAQKMEVLELMADCFYKTNRMATAIDLLQTVAHHEKKNLRVKEKIADCLTKQRQYLKANLIYATISKKLGVAHANLLKAKIDKNNELLKAFQVWPSFHELMHKIGIDSGRKMTPAELSSITAFQREVNPRAYLMWDIEMNKVKRAKIPAMEADPNVKKFPVYLSDGSVLKDDMGNPIHLYKSQDLALLTHFTKPSLANMILDTLNKDKLRPPGESDPHSFWKSQFKVCCSMLKQGSQSFYGVNNTAAVGLAVYDPDPLSNILHTWGEDCYTPTYFNAPGVQAATGQSGAEKALLYNEFMARFQPLTSYVYSVFQHADRLQQQIEVRNQFLELQRDISSRLTRVKLPIIDALFNKLTSFFPKLDPGKQRLEAVISEIEEAIRTSDLGDAEIQDNIILKLNSLKDLLQDEGESLRSKAVGKRIKTLFDGIAKAVPVREGGEATRTSLYKNPQLKKPLISLYIEETKTIVSNLLRSGMNEDELFTTLFRRPPRAGETVLEALREIDRSLETLYESNKSIIYKDASRAPRSNHIWTRTLTPNELVSSVQSGKYSEIGVRGHDASDLVNANHVSFAGIVLEEGMTIRPSGDGYVIDPIHSASWLGEPVAPQTLVDVIKKAHAEGLPSFVVGA